MDGKAIGNSSELWQCTYGEWCTGAKAVRKRSHVNIGFVGCIRNGCIPSGLSKSHPKGCHGRPYQSKMRIANSFLDGKPLIFVFRSDVLHAMATERAVHPVLFVKFSASLSTRDAVSEKAKFVLPMIVATIYRSSWQRQLHNYKQQPRKLCTIRCEAPWAPFTPSDIHFCTTK